MKSQKQIVDGNWLELFRSISLKSSYLSLTGSYNLLVTEIIESLSLMPEIKGVFLLVKEKESYEVRESSGYKSTVRKKILSIHDYAGSDITVTNPFIIMHGFPYIDTPSIQAIHLPITSGIQITGVLTLLARSSDSFMKCGISNFETITKILSYLLVHSEMKENKEEEKKIEADLSDDAVSYLKTIVRMTLISSENFEKAFLEAADFLTSNIKCEGLVFFRIRQDELKYDISSGKIEKNAIKEFKLPLSIIKDRKAFFLTELEKLPEMKGFPYSKVFNTALISTSYAGSSLKGILMALYSDEKNLSHLKLGLLQLASNRIAEFIELNELRNDLKENKNVLESLEKLQDSFTAMISHELRTPLTGIKGFTEVILNQDAGGINEMQSEFLTNVLKSTKTLENTINSIIDLTNIKKGKTVKKIESVRWNNFIEQIFYEFKSNIDAKKIHSELSLPEKEQILNVDRNLMHSALSNVLLNAVKFTEPGGHVEIYVQNNENTVMTSITDTGKGIPKETKKMIFEQFFQDGETLEREYGGLGLGLALTKKIIQLHDGNIEIFSVEDRGSEFRITLPK